MKSLYLCAATLLTAISVSAQNNLVSNGDFQTGSLAPWAVRSSVGNLQVSIVEKAKVGTAEDRALEVQMKATSAGIYAIDQDIVLPSTGWYQLSLVGRRISGFGSVQLDVAPAMTGWDWAPHSVVQDHFVSVGTPILLPAGQFRCGLWLRNLPGSTFTCQIDEIVVRPVQLPALVFDDTRVYAYDQALRHFLVAYASLQRLSTPITLPGWQGGFDLDPFREGGLVYVGLGVSDPGRPATLVILPPAVSFLGRTIYLQAIDLTGQVFGSRLGVRWRP